MYDNLSGAGAFVSRGARGEAVVVGVPAAFHSPTASTPDTGDNYTETMSTISARRGAMACTLVCEPIRVKEFVNYLHNQHIHQQV